MTWQRQFTKKRLWFFVAAAAFYAGLWILTYRLGAPQVRSVAVEAMHRPSSYTDVSKRSGNRHTGPVYWCSIRTYAPFLVRAKYGWQGGPLYGDGGSTLYLWLFGRTFRLREIEHWAS